MCCATSSLRPASSTRTPRAWCSTSAPVRGGSRAPQGEFDPDPGFGRRRGGVRLRRSANEPGLATDRRSNSVCHTSTATTARPVAESAPDSGAAQSRHRDDVSGVADRTELYWVFTLPGRGAGAVRAVREHARFPPHAIGQTGRDTVTGARRPSRMPVAATAGGVLGATDAGRTARRRQDDFRCRRGQLGGIELRPTATRTLCGPGRVDVERR